MKTLHNACLQGNLEQVRDLLLEKTVNVNQIHHGKTALHVACEVGYSEIVRELLSHDDIDIHKLNAQGKEALDIARLNNHNEIFYMLKAARYKDSVLKTKILPHGQCWLMDRMSALGYKIDPHGICCGLGRMARQAFLAGDYENFVRRLVSLATDCSPEAFAMKIRLLEQEANRFLQQALAEKNLTKKRALLERRMTNQNELTDIHAFFTSVVLRHKPELYTQKDELFEGFSVSQDTDSAETWLTPVVLDKDPIVKRKSFSAAYKDTNDIKKYLDTINFYLSNDTFSLSLDVSDHTIELSYSPQSKWLLTDTNKLPGVFYEDTGELAKAIHNGLFQSIRFLPISEAFFSTTFFCIKKNSALIDEHIKKLESESGWPSKYNQITLLQTRNLRILMEKGVLFDDLFSLPQEKFDVLVMALNTDILEKITLSELGALELDKLEFLLRNFESMPFDLPRIKFILGKLDAINCLAELNIHNSELFAINMDKLALILNHPTETVALFRYYLIEEKTFSDLIGTDFRNLKILLDHPSEFSELARSGVRPDVLAGLDKTRLEMVLMHNSNLQILLYAGVKPENLLGLDTLKLEMVLAQASNLLDLILDEVNPERLLALDTLKLKIVLTYASNLLDLIMDEIKPEKLLGLDTLKLEMVLTHASNLSDLLCSELSIEDLINLETDKFEIFLKYSSNILALLDTEVTKKELFELKIETLKKHFNEINGINGVSP